jgi:hypothetical protein
LFPGPAVDAYFSALAALSASDEHGTAGLVEVALLEGERLADPQACRPEQHDECAQPLAVSNAADRSHHGDDLLDRRRIGRVLLALVARRPASVTARHGRRRADRARVRAMRLLHGAWWEILVSRLRPSRHEQA